MGEVIPYQKAITDLVNHLYGLLKARMTPFRRALPHHYAMRTATVH